MYPHLVGTDNHAGHLLSRPVGCRLHEAPGRQRINPVGGEGCLRSSPRQLQIFGEKSPVYLSGLAYLTLCSCSAKNTSLTATLTSVTLRPTRLSTRLMMFWRTAWAIWGIDLPYSTVSVASIAASTSPTSTETPRDWLPLPTLPPVTLLKIPPIAWLLPPPIRTPSTSCAAMPAILETTLSSILVPPRSVWSGLSCCWVLCSLMLLCSLL